MPEVRASSLSSTRETFAKWLRENDLTSLQAKVFEENDETGIHIFNIFQVYRSIMRKELKELQQEIKSPHFVEKFLEFYDKIIDPDVLITANNIAKSLNINTFTSADAFRSWLDDPQNSALILRIRFLSLSCLGLKHLPQEVNKLRNLRILHLHGNETLEWIPPSISLLSRVELKVDINKQNLLPSKFSK